jgi:hypothetical protein
VAYQPNIFTWDPSHPAKSALFKIPGVHLTPGRNAPLAGTSCSSSTKLASARRVTVVGVKARPGVRCVHLTPGRAFTPTTVTRLADANFVELEQEVPANGE